MDPLHDVVHQPCIASSSLANLQAHPTYFTQSLVTRCVATNVKNHVEVLSFASHANNGMTTTMNPTNGNVTMKRVSKKKNLNWLVSWMDGQMFQGDERNSPTVMYCSAGPSSVLLMLPLSKSMLLSKRNRF